MWGRKNKSNGLIDRMTVDGCMFLAIRESDAASMIGALAERFDAVKSPQETMNDAYRWDVQETENGEYILSPYELSDGVAYIPVHGLLINRFDWAFGWITGYRFLSEALRVANADSRVREIVFDVDSCGGEAAGCFELAEEIRASAKPTTATVDSSCYSAAYAIASACDKIVATPSSGVGSIGVICVHMSYGSMLEKWGVDVTIIKAGERKADGNPFEKLGEDAQQAIQHRVNMLYNSFVSSVATGRNLDEKAVIDTQAACFTAAEALDIGLIDALGKYQTVGDSMETQNKEAAVAERTRIAAIVQSAEAEGRGELAQHLAFKTDMTADAAVAILAVAPKQEAPAATVPSLDSMMAAAGSPQVGADGEQDDDADKVDVAAIAALVNGG